jgi:monoamine oxidase
MRFAGRSRFGQVDGNASETMKKFSRRSFLAGSAAALAARPASGAPASVDLVVVGAGAAGIAATRRLVAAGRRVALVEAMDRVGGRCFTDIRTFGVPYDRGAHWIYLRDANPLAQLAPRAGVDVYPAPRGQTLRIGRRNAREGESEIFLAALVRSNRAIADAARGKADLACAQALPKDLGEWRSTVEFVLGPYGCAKDLAEVSAFDFAKSAERDVASFCRQGFGALLAKLAQGLPVQLSTPVARIESGGRGVEVETARGRLSARAAIVTVSTNVLAAGKIKFAPELPRRQLDAVNRLKLGSFDHIALELPGNPLGLQRDDLVFERASGPRTAALLANVSGTPLAMIEVGGRFGRELMAKGDMAAVDFAVEWLTGLFGSNFKRAVQRTQSTRWNDEPWVQGAMSTASPGVQWARAALREPVRDRVYFAGEATHETLWGTVGGAWESGERAADSVVRRLSGLPEPPPPKPEAEPVAAQPRRGTTAQAKPEAKRETKPAAQAKAKSRGGSTKSKKRQR